MVGVNRKYHRRMHTRGYYASINRILKRYDPDRNIDPCDFSGFNNIRVALRQIGEYIKDGKWNG